MAPQGSTARSRNILRHFEASAVSKCSHGIAHNIEDLQVASSITWQPLFTKRAVYREARACLADLVGTGDINSRRRLSLKIIARALVNGRRNVRHMQSFVEILAELAAARKAEKAALAHKAVCEREVAEREEMARFEAELLADLAGNVATSLVSAASPRSSNSLPKIATFLTDLQFSLRSSDSQSNEVLHFADIRLRISACLNKATALAKAAMHAQMDYAAIREVLDLLLDAIRDLQANWPDAPPTTAAGNADDDCKSTPKNRRQRRTSITSASKLEKALQQVVAAEEAFSQQVGTPARKRRSMVGAIFPQGRRESAETIRPSETDASTQQSSMCSEQKRRESVESTAPPDTDASTDQASICSDQSSVSTDFPVEASDAQQTVSNAVPIGLSIAAEVAALSAQKSEGIAYILEGELQADPGSVTPLKPEHDRNCQGKSAHETNSASQCFVSEEVLTPRARHRDGAKLTLQFSASRNSLLATASAAGDWVNGKQLDQNWLLNSHDLASPRACDFLVNDALDVLIKRHRSSIDHTADASTVSCLPPSLAVSKPVVSDKLSTDVEATEELLRHQSSPTQSQGSRTPRVKIDTQSDATPRVTIDIDGEYAIHKIDDACSKLLLAVHGDARKYDDDHATGLSSKENTLPECCNIVSTPSASSRKIRRPLPPSLKFKAAEALGSHRERESFSSFHSARVSGRSSNGLQDRDPPEGADYFDALLSAHSSASRIMPMSARSRSEARKTCVLSDLLNAGSSVLNGKSNLVPLQSSSMRCPEISPPCCNLGAFSLNRGDRCLPEEVATAADDPAARSVTVRCKAGSDLRLKQGGQNLTVDDLPARMRCKPGSDFRTKEPGYERSLRAPRVSSGDEYAQEFLSELCRVSQGQFSEKRIP